MRHFGHLSPVDIDGLFERPPEPFDRGSAAELLSVALGATLYLPADRPALVADITKQAAAGVTSMVVCLEDAIADERVAQAQDNVVDALRTLAGGPTGDLPLLFVRVRSPAQIPALVTRLGPAAHVLDGFVLPKFTVAGGAEYLRALDEAGPRFLAMPVIESDAVLYAETRMAELTDLRALLQVHRRRILAVRLGATDLCALYGLRRPPEFSIYDITVVAGLIADVVNLLGRADGTGFTISGPVWEYFGGAERIFKPQLRRTPFTEHNAPELRGELMSRSMDGLIREVQLDRANGLTGKTAIHPEHVAIVNAMSVVPAEEHRDALDILRAGPGGGVLASGRKNKMNEVRPHTTWARRTALRGRVFGVAAEGVSFVDLLTVAAP